jgi:hypothetical protein
MVSAIDKMQQNLFINSFKLALHVVGDSFAHLQEHFDCTYSFLGQCTDSAVLQAGDTDWMEFHPICVQQA